MGRTQGGTSRYCTIFTLTESYCSFLTFYVRIRFRESRLLPWITWFVAVGGSSSQLWGTKSCG
jgi:hypothetical protein